MLALATALLLPACALAMSLRVGTPHLFLDLDGVASAANLTTALGSLAKDYEAPIVAGEDPWDAFMAGYSSLLLAPVAGVPTYFLYYCCAARPGANRTQAGNYVCVATTTDGRAWAKPALTAFPWGAQPTNRVFYTGPGDNFMGNVFLDAAPGVPASERFKLLYSAPDPSGAYGGVYLAASADGLLFRAVASPSVPLPPHFGDTQPAVVWDAARARYAAFGRGDAPLPNSTAGCRGGNPATRQVLGAFSATGAGGGFGPAAVLLSYGAPDQADCLDVYNSSPLPAVDDSSSLLFLPSSYRHFAQAGAWGNSSNDGVLDVRLAVSRDGGATAAFVSRDALIPRGTGALAAPGAFTGDPDAGCVFATSGGLLDPDLLAPPPPPPPQRAPLGRQGLLPYAAPSPRVWLLFYGTQRTHWPVWSPSSDPGANGIFRGSLRREGYAGLRTPTGDPAGAGAFTTVPLLVPQPAAACGSASAQLWLLLNVQTSVAGGASVALLAPGSLAPLPGRGPAEALPFFGDSVRAPASWAPAAAAGGDPVRDLAPFAGTQVVLSVSLVHAHLFAWELQCVQGAG